MRCFHGIDRDALSGSLGERLGIDVGDARARRDHDERFRELVARIAEIDREPEGHADDITPGRPVAPPLLDEEGASGDQRSNRRRPAPAPWPPIAPRQGLRALHLRAQISSYRA
jgi:hypothetical protein